MQLLVLILLSVLAYSAMMGSRITISLTALQLTNSAAAAGALMAIFTVMPILLGIFCGRLLDRVGIARPLAGAALLSCGALLLPWFFPAVWGLALASAANGIAFMVAAMGLGNAAAAMGTVEQRTANIGWVFLGNSAGMAIGPLLAGFGIDHIGYRQSFVLLAALPLVSGVLLATGWRFIPDVRARHARATAHPPGRLLHALTDPGLRTLIVAQVLAGACLEAFYFIVPLHGHRIGISASTIGVIITCAFIANCASRSFMPMLLRRNDERGMVTVVFAIAGASILPFALFSQPLVLMLLAAGVGICHGVALPILSSLTYTASPEGRQGEVGGVRTVFVNGAVSLTQVTAGSLSAIVGIAPVTWLVALAAFGGGWYARRLRAAA